MPEDAPVRFKKTLFCEQCGRPMPYGEPRSGTDFLKCFHCVRSEAKDAYRKLRLKRWNPYPEHHNFLDAST